MRYIPPSIHATDQGKRAAITFCHSIDSSVVKKLVTSWSQTKSGGPIIDQKPAKYVAGAIAHNGEQAWGTFSLLSQNNRGDQRWSPPVIW